jgi:hypothetical protein
MKIVNFFTYVFFGHFKIILIISSCVVLNDNMNVDEFKLNFGLWFW